MGNDSFGGGSGLRTRAMGPPSLQTRFPFLATSVSRHTAPPRPASCVCPPAPRPRRGVLQAPALGLPEIALLVPCPQPALTTGGCCGHPVAHQDPQGTSFPYPSRFQPVRRPGHCPRPPRGSAVAAPATRPLGSSGQPCAPQPGGPAGAVVRAACPASSPTLGQLRPGHLPPGPGLVSGPTQPFGCSLSGNPGPQRHALWSLIPLATSASTAAPTPTCEHCRAWLRPLCTPDTVVHTRMAPRVTSPMLVCPHTQGSRPVACLATCPRGLST